MIPPMDHLNTDLLEKELQNTSARINLFTTPTVHISLLLCCSLFVRPAIINIYIMYRSRDYLYVNVLFIVMNLSSTLQFPSANTEQNKNKYCTLCAPSEQSVTLDSNIFPSGDG